MITNLNWCVPVFWLVAMIIFLIAECATVGLVSVWFAVGALAALVVSLLGGNFAIQLLTFAIVSVIALALTKPLVRIVRAKTPFSPTNGDRNIGRIATVIAPITAAAPGRIRLDGVDWAAHTADCSALPVGALCRITGMQSTLLIVEPAKETCVPPSETGL